MADLSLVFDLLARDKGASEQVGKVGDSFSKAGDQADGFGERVSGMWGGLLAGAAGAGLAVGAAFFETLDQQGQNRQLAGSLGLDPAQAAAAGKAAGDLYAQNYGDSLEQVNEALGQVMSSINGLGDASSAATQEATRDALNFASAFQVDTSEAVQTVGQLIQNGLAPDASSAFDLMTAAYQKVPAAMRDELPAILQEYGTNFRALGFTGPQAFQLLTGAAEQGQFALDKTGDALKEFTIRATDGSASTAAAYQLLGEDAQAMATSVAAGGESAQIALQATAQDLLKIEDPAQRAQAAIALFGTPLEDLSVDQIPAFLGSIANVGPGMQGVQGAADALDSTLGTGVGPTLETIKRGAQQAATEGMGALLAGFTQGSTDAGGWQGTLQNLAATVSSTLQPALDGLSSFVTGTLGPALSAVFDWMTQHQTTVTVFAAVISGVLAAAFGVWATRATIAAATNAIAWVSAVVSSNAGAAGVELSALQVVASWVLMGVQSMLQAARMAAAWLIALGPIGLVIAAVVGIVVLIIANWDKIKQWTIDAWNAVVGAVSGAWNSVTSAISSGISSAVSFVSGLPGKIVSGLGNLGSTLYNAGSDLINGLLNGAKSILSNIGTFFLNMVPSWIRGPFESALGIASPSTVFYEYGQNIGQGLVNGVTSMQPAVEDAIGGLVPPNVDQVLWGSVSEQTWDALIAQGWRGRAGDNLEALYRPAQATTSFAAPAYNGDALGSSATGSAGSRTVYVSGVASPETVAALVAREQRTDEFLAGGLL